MRTEVVRWETCPQCGGHISWPGVEYAGHDGMGGCSRCFCMGAMPIVLATLPDRAELREQIDETIASWMDETTPIGTPVVDRVLAIFGLGEEST